MLSTADGDLSGVNDEFEQVGAISNFQLYNDVEGKNADQLATRDVNQTNVGRMTIRPRIWGGDARFYLPAENCKLGVLWLKPLLTERDLA